MTDETNYCPRCGVSVEDTRCVRCEATEPTLYDRNGDTIWESLPRFCAACGARLAHFDDRDQHTCEQPKLIHFYSVADRFGELSNFAAFPIRIGGKTWPTTEHYFQAQKFAGTGHEEAVRRANSPMLAARLGRDRSQKLRPDWESVKIEVMRTALRAKFTQHAELRELLLSTGDAKLVEHTRNDAFWGDGGDGSGKNWLGRLLMRLRAELSDGGSP